MKATTMRSIIRGTLQMSAVIVLSIVYYSFIPILNVFGQEQPKADGKAKQREPEGLTKYLGRRVAQPMGYSHMNWLSRPERIQ